MTTSYEAVAKLGFGAMRLPLTDPDDVTAIDIESVKTMVDEFIARGGTYVDTAFVYHNGVSETALREALVERYPREAFTLATKCLAWACASKEEAQACLPTSLERLGVDYIDYYLLHNLGGARTAKFDEYDMWNYVAKAKADGLIRHVGFSMHDGADVLDELLTAHPEVDFVQLQVNYLDWDDPVTQSARCMEVAAKHGMPVIIMEPVRGGRLANLPERGAAVLAEANPEASQASWAYRFCLDLPGVLTVLAGASTLEQMRDNMATFQTHKPLTDAERDAIAEVVAALRSVDLIPCTNCGYCVKDCPEGVKIPVALNLLNLEKTTEDRDFAKGLYSWQAAEGPASKCIQCGTCEAACPQSIPVITRLAEAVDHFEG
ncbi:aldo/keto reductase [Adlercreutzia muris]|uniref:aldo/keto reductase n=1 Tax=Adlercreutzia muris TaxID=1796610 RepID=UPI0013657F6A|nr:aldo/keto reductase [Adlercreutzia muris]NCA31330.1 Fe-S oxidoreductase [Adlercreutzia muris]